MKALAESAPRSTLQQPPAMLVIDDDDGDFTLLKRALYKAGATARVWWAKDPEEALALLRQLQQSRCHVCVVMDIRLGGADGWDLLAEIKRQKEPDVKCILLTGMTDQATRHRACAEGVDGFFTKPCDSAGLLQVARELQKVAVE